MVEGHRVIRIALEVESGDARRVGEICIRAGVESVDCDPADVHIGMALEGFIHEDEDGFKLPLFRPAS